MRLGTAVPVNRLPQSTAVAARAYATAGALSASRGRCAQSLPNPASLDRTTLRMCPRRRSSPTICPAAHLPTHTPPPTTTPRSRRAAASCSAPSRAAITSRRARPRSRQPPQLREAIFDPYRQVRPDSYVSGLGLGLFVSRQIAELHGGWLRATDPDGQGGLAAPETSEAPHGEQGISFVVWLPSVR